MRKSGFIWDTATLFSTQSGLDWDTEWLARVKQVNGGLTVRLLSGSDQWIQYLVLCPWCFGTSVAWRSCMTLCPIESVTLQWGGLSLSSTSDLFFKNYFLLLIFFQKFVRTEFHGEYVYPGKFIENTGILESLKSGVSVQATERFKGPQWTRELDSFIGWCLRSTCESVLCWWVLWLSTCFSKIDVQSCYRKKEKDKFIVFVINPVV